MIMKISSQMDADINVEDVMYFCDISDGMSNIAIQKRVFDYLMLSLNPPEGMRTNLEEVSDLITDEILSKLKYYIII